MKTKPKQAKNKKIKINTEVYDKIKRQADKAAQSIDEYAEKLLSSHKENGDGAKENNDADSS